MDFLQWLDKVVFDVPAIKAVAVISLCCAIGLSLGKFKIKGIGLGVTWVFFMGIFRNPRNTWCETTACPNHLS